MSRPRSHPVVLHTGPLVWESNALTTRPLLLKVTQLFKHSLKSLKTKTTTSPLPQNACSHQTWQGCN